MLSFSVALAEEYRKQGIRVLALCPGATETPFFDIASKEAAVGRKRTTEQVVATGLRAFERGQKVVIDGANNNILAQSARLMPRAAIARMAGRMIRPREAQPQRTKTNISPVSSQR